MKLADFAKNNHWITLGVIALVVGILVVPDLFKGRNKGAIVANSQTEEAHHSTETTVGEVAENVPQRDTGAVAVKEVRTGKENIIDELAGNYGSFFARFQTSGGKNQVTRKMQKYLEYYSLLKAEVPIDVVNLPESHITWEYLRSSSVKSAIKKGQEKIKKLILQLAKYPEMAKRLGAFIYMTSDFYAGESQGLSALGVIHSLEDEEGALTEAMLSAGVPRSIFFEWAKISFSRVYGSSSLLEYKFERIPPFNPRFIITKVSIPLPKNNINSVGPQLSDYLVSFQAVFRGSDVKKVVLRRVGFSESAVIPKAVLEDSEQKIISVNRVAAAGIYQIILTDIFNNTISKEYSFDPRYRKLPWNDQDKSKIVANLPPQTGVGTIYLKDRIDLTGQVDSYFRYGSSSSSIENFNTPESDGSFVGPNQVGGGGRGRGQW